MSISTTTIRAAVFSDVQDIRSCAEAAYQHYIARMNQVPAPMLADFDRQVKSGIVSVAICNNELVGYVVYYALTDCMHLENVAVLPACSGLGIGKQLIRHVETQAVAARLSRVELYTNEMMHENLAMYPKLGYMETARKTQSGFKRVFFSKTVI